MKLSNIKSRIFKSSRILKLRPLFNKTRSWRRYKSRKKLRNMCLLRKKQNLFQKNCINSPLKTLRISQLFMICSLKKNLQSNTSSNLMSFRSVQFCTYRKNRVYSWLHIQVLVKQWWLSMV